MNYKSIFIKNFFTNHFSKGENMSRSIVSAGSKVFESAVMFFVLIFVGVGGSVVYGQGLEGVWVFDKNEDNVVIFPSNSYGIGDGYNFVRNCTVYGSYGSGRGKNNFRRGTDCVDKFLYEVRDRDGGRRGVISIKGYVGKNAAMEGTPLRTNYVPLESLAEQIYEDTWTFEILENGNYLKLNDLTLKRVEDVEKFKKDKAEKTAQTAAIGKAYGDGNAAMDAKNYDAAITNFTEAIRLAPNPTGASFAYISRAKAFTGKKDYDRAIADYEKALELDQSALVYLGRGDMYIEKQDYERAISDFNKALEVCGNDICRKDAKKSLKNAQNAQKKNAKKK